MKISLWKIEKNFIFRNKVIIITKYQTAGVYNKVIFLPSILIKFSSFRYFNSLNIADLRILVEDIQDIIEEKLMELENII